MSEAENCFLEKSAVLNIVGSVLSAVVEAKVIMKGPRHIELFLFKHSGMNDSCTSLITRELNAFPLHL